MNSKDKLDRLGELADVKPALSWDRDERNRCWRLLGGPPGRRVRCTVEARFWDRASMRIEADGGLVGAAISHGRGIPGIDALTNPEEALDLAIETVSGWLEPRAKNGQK